MKMRKDRKNKGKTLSRTKGRIKANWLHTILLLHQSKLEFLSCHRRESTGVLILHYGPNFILFIYLFLPPSDTLHISSKSWLISDLWLCDRCPHGKIKIHEVPVACRHHSVSAPHGLVKINRSPTCWQLCHPCLWSDCCKNDVIVIILVSVAHISVKSMQIRTTTVFKP